MQRLTATVLALTLSLSTAVLARSTAPQLPAPIANAQPNLALVGHGTFTWFVFQVYDAWLWAPDGRWAPDTAFVLDLRYARTLKGDAIAARSLEEIRRVQAVSAAQLEAWGTFMRAAFPDVGEGDRLTGEFLPGGVTRFYFNGELNAELDDPAFGRAFAGIWLAPDTSAQQLRRDLLGEAADTR